MLFRSVDEALREIARGLRVARPSERLNAQNRGFGAQFTAFELVIVAVEGCQGQGEGRVTPTGGPNRCWLKTARMSRG